MSDLIRRDNVVSRISDLLMIELQGKRLPTWNEVYHAINDIPSAEPERTAKVEDIQVEWGDDEYVNDRMGAMYHYGNCGNCGETVSHNQKYCHECGAKLEWDE